MVATATPENNDLFDMFRQLRKSYAASGIVKNQQLSGSYLYSQ